jgi:acyl-CoA thioester hydrolase
VTVVAGAGAEPVSWRSHACTIALDWVDYNGHMNVAYYVLVFDRGTDWVLDRLGLDEAYRQRTGCSVFVAEAHVTYEREVMAGERVTVSSRILDFDGKRLILFHDMADAETGRRVATNEVLCLHVDLNYRRATAFPEPAARAIGDALALHRRLPRPAAAGRAIGIAARRPDSDG